MMHTRALIRVAGLAAAWVLSAGIAHAGAIPAPIAAAIANPDRPDADRQRDAVRKPAEILAYAGVKPGDIVGELAPGGGYFTRIISNIVGARGHVYGFAAPPPPDASPDMPDFTARIRAIAADPQFSNVSVVLQPYTFVNFPVPLDLVWTSQNYHDFHNVPGIDMVAFNRQIFDSLKPGGVYLILDHAGAPGTGATQTSTLHRIDPQTVEMEVEAAGFVLDDRSNLLQRGEDPHSGAVFDPEIRGKTDQFILKFHKPTVAKKP